MEFRILGPLEVVDGCAPIELGGRKPRTLLAALLLHANEVVSAERLIDALWDDQPPQTAHAALQVHISHLRRVLGRERIVTRAPGYLLRVDPGELDVQRFERLLTDAREGEPTVAEARLRDALAGVARLEARRLGAVELRSEQDLACGGHAAVLGELDTLVAAYPYRGRLRAQRMLALYRSGRQADALEAYRAARETLATELGIEPGPELRRLERAVLDHDPELDLAATAPAV